MIIRSTSKMRCEFEKTSPELFFSLVDYRNKLFTSNEPENILEFYNGFNNRDQLIQWMKERPKGSSYIHEVEGDKDIIVVIPTADFNGKYAINCRENIFKGLHMIFVESGGKDDIYFNYAHNCNVGIKRAMEYNPKWVVVSNDDMIKIDDVSKLREELESVENNAYLIWTEESTYHSYILSVRENNLIGKAISHLSSAFLKVKADSYYANTFCIRKKFSINYFALTKRNGLIYHSSNKIRDVRITSSFSIFSYMALEKLKCNVFDDVYINGYEDIELSLMLTNVKTNHNRINYNIGDMVGSTLGLNLQRTYRDFANTAYFNHKISENLLKISVS